MNKYITPLTENEVLAWQNDCLNPENRFIPYPGIFAGKAPGNMTPLFYGFRRFLGTLTGRVKVLTPFLCFKENFQI